MKNILRSTIAIFALLLMVNCQEDNLVFGTLSAPTNLDVTVEIVGKTDALPNGDGSGTVKFKSTADGAISYKYIYGDGVTENSPGGIVEHGFTTVGVNTYTVTVIAYGKGGLATNETVEVTVFSNFSDERSTQFLTGGTATGKKWYLAASEKGHLGVGQNDGDATKNYFANYYQAEPFEKSATCFYDGDYTFALVNGKIEYKQDNKGNTFFHNSYKSVAGGTNGGDDACLAYSTAGTKIVSLSPSTSVVSKNPAETRVTTGTVMNFSDGGFMGYYAGATQYEILSITENRMVVRLVQGNNAALAWYLIFTTTIPTSSPDPDYTVLKFSDEFNTDGAPDATKWTYDLGTGTDGWGNNEAQSYTNASDNVIVAGGSLKITAKKVGSSYTSARLKTEGKFDFTYGKVEVRAKLPVGGGTWPAIWMLGADYATNTWPACGEIDIMEHKGNEPNKIHGTLHYPGRSGGNGNTNTTTITNASSEFHVYKAVWSPASVKIYVDDVLFHTVTNDSSLPFNKDFFMILNVAMGGTFGGTIDPAFTQSSMEVDYVRVYQ
ncbi:family 16 glycosylhydrolase [Flavobacterium commune]|uniref:Laminarinase n=1 Tax=Flavobacterium commune TaxID=1306519 RepID=A0A1D9P7B2_9FLAO|nr:family 16 glycosylhydrolase [Flavobacterium commune]AOZ98403.1 laminarinase [Flavobacterium commune]